MKMKCTYRLLVLLAAASSLLILLTATGNVFICHSFPLLYSVYNSTPLHPPPSPAPLKDDQALVLPWKGERSGANEGKEVKRGKIWSTVAASSIHYQRHHQRPSVISRMVLAVVCCGDRLNETRTMLKSAAALSRSALTMVVFTEDQLKPAFTEMHALWPSEVRRRITLDLHSITFPPGQDAASWRKLFKPCASQRLFMPSLLKEIDALIYVDTDVLFLAPLEELWGHFSAMNSSHMAAMAPEHEDLATGWYNRFAKHPFYGRLGVNSGVMLMNLTRLRRFGWEEYVVPIYRYYRLAITWGDQDIINIIFHFHPDKLYVYGCEYNLRPDHCMYMSVCRTAETRGIFVLHGNRGTFHTHKQPAFRAVYRAWEQYHLGQDLRQDLYYPMQRLLLATTNTTCGKMHAAFLKVLSSSVRLR